MRPLLAAGLAAGTAMKLAFASDTVSITIMKIVDSALMLVIPGAMDAPIDSGLFWVSLAVSLLVAGVVAFPVPIITDRGQDDGLRSADAVPPA